MQADDQITRALSRRRFAEPWPKPRLDRTYSWYRTTSEGDTSPSCVMRNRPSGRAVALDGKLYCIDLLALLCYDPQADAWTVEQTELPWQDMARAAHEQFIFSFRIVEAIPHQGRIVVFLSNGAAFERATDGSWSRHEVAEGTIPDNGYDSMHAASIPIG